MNNGSSPSPNQPSPLILQMYQMAHNELLTRIQQRDQYYICIFCSFIALLASTLGIESAQNIKIALFTFSVFAFILMFFLTCLLFSSCSIYKEAIKQIRAIEEAISKNGDGTLDTNVTLWQHHIDSAKPNHLRNSFIRAKSIFISLDLFALAILIMELHLFFLL